MPGRYKKAANKKAAKRKTTLTKKKLIKKSKKITVSQRDQYRDGDEEYGDEEYMDEYDEDYEEENADEYDRQIQASIRELHVNRPESIILTKPPKTVFLQGFTPFIFDGEQGVVVKNFADSAIQSKVAKRDEGHDFQGSAARLSTQEGADFKKAIDDHDKKHFRYTLKELYENDIIGHETECYSEAQDRALLDHLEGKSVTGTERIHKTTKKNPEGEPEKAFVSGDITESAKFKSYGRMANQSGMYVNDQSCAFDQGASIRRGEAFKEIYETSTIYKTPGTIFDASSKNVDPSHCYTEDPEKWTKTGVGIIQTFFDSKGNAHTIGIYCRGRVKSNGEYGTKIGIYNGTSWSYYTEETLEPSVPAIIEGRYVTDSNREKTSLTTSFGEHVTVIERLIKFFGDFSQILFCEMLNLVFITHDNSAASIAAYYENLSLLYVSDTNFLFRIKRNLDKNQITKQKIHKIETQIQRVQTDIDEKEAAANRLITYTKRCRDALDYMKNDASSRKTIEKLEARYPDIFSGVDIKIALVIGFLEKKIKDSENEIIRRQSLILPLSNTIKNYKNDLAEIIRQMENYVNEETRGEGQVGREIEIVHVDDPIHKYTDEAGKTLVSKDGPDFVDQAAYINDEESLRELIRRVIRTNHGKFKDSTNTNIDKERFVNEINQLLFKHGDRFAIDKFYEILQHTYPQSINTTPRGDISLNDKGKDYIGRLMSQEYERALLEFDRFRYGGKRRKNTYTKKRNYKPRGKTYKKIRTNSIKRNETKYNRSKSIQTKHYR